MYDVCKSTIIVDYGVRKKYIRNIEKLIGIFIAANNLQKG